MHLYYEYFYDNINAYLRFLCIYQNFLVKMEKNTKLLQSEEKILECDWSENYRIQENADFLVKMEKNTKLLQSEIKILECDWSEKRISQKMQDFLVKMERIQNYSNQRKKF